MTAWTEELTRTTFQAIARRSATDPAFRKLALTNPHAAIRQVAGMEPPPGFTVRFVENAGASMTLVLPDAVGNRGELSDTDLEQVAGGRCGASHCGISCYFSSSM